MTEVIGILNITPDSFYDGGLYFSHDSAIKQAAAMIEDGVDIIDVGAESTRPGSTPINANQEAERLFPILDRIVGMAKTANVAVSVDTYKTEIAAMAIDCGANIINCIYTDIDCAARMTQISDKVIFTHALTIPASKDVNLEYNIDPIQEVIAWSEQILSASSIGCNVIIDPGIGFGKTDKQSWKIIREIKKLMNFDICVGHSNKRFIGNIDRPSATLGISVFLAIAGVKYIRVHDIKSHCAILNALGLR